MSGPFDYFFCQDSMFVIPIEHLTPSGMSREFRAELDRRSLVPDGWSGRFDAAYLLYRQRAAQLATRAAAEWLPPRALNVCIITDAPRVRPYFQPFNQSAWLLFVDDFDPASSSLERSAFMFVHSERLGLTRDLTRALLHNLSYFLLLSDEQAADFAEGCRRSRRPDAAGFRALAAALPWIRSASHPQLQPSARSPLAAPLSLPGTALTLSPAAQPQLERLQQAWQAAARTALDHFHATYTRHGKERGGELCRWIADNAPQLVLTTGAEIVWDVARPHDTAALRRLLGGISSATADSLRADWQVIDRHSRAFLAALTAQATLPPVHADTAQTGLSYIHRERRLIAYNLNEPGMERLKVPAPPYERLMLGARTIHEWGHLAADAGWVRVPEAEQPTFDAAVRQLCELVERVAQGVPPRIAELIAPEMQRLRVSHGSVGWGLVQVVLGRMSDFQSNLLARVFLDLDEIDTYVRNNVVSRLGSSRPSAVLQRLLRYSFEYQYLRFGRMPDAGEYFRRCTWFAEEYLETHIVDAADFAEMLRLVGALCDAQRPDPAFLMLPGF